MAPQSQEPLHIEERPGSGPDQRILTLNGPVVLTNVFSFQNAIRSKTSRLLILDFTQVPYIDSAAIGALVGAHVTHNKDGRALALVGVNDRVRNALKITHVEEFFHFYPTLDGALQRSA